MGYCIDEFRDSLIMDNDEESNLIVATTTIRSVLVVL
jgi:hypothetical protein